MLLIHKILLCLTYIINTIYSTKMHSYKANLQVVNLVHLWRGRL